MSVLWFGPTTYTLPIRDSSVLNKIRYISQNFSLYILALYPRFQVKIATYQKTHFYLLPKIPMINSIIQLIVSPIILIFLLIKHRIDLISSQGVTVYGLISIIIKKILSIFGISVKVLIDIHGDWEKTPFLYRGKDPSDFGSDFIKRIGHFVLNNGDAIRVVNRVLCEKAASMTRKPIYVLPIYLDTDFFLKEPLSSEQEPTQKKLILFAGGLYYLKGIQYLIQAMSMIVEQRNDIELVIAGKGPYRKELQLLTRKYNLQDSVRFVGHVSKRFLKNLFYSSSVVVLPSLSEGLPRVIIEAMACARAVIATDVGGIRELIKEGENGLLVPPADSAALQSKIVFLLTHPEISQKLGENGRNFVIRNFNGKNLLKGYVELYKNALRD